MFVSRAKGFAVLVVVLEMAWENDRLETFVKGKLSGNLYWSNMV